MTDDLAGARWFKSSKSTASKECVEVAHLDSGVVGVRDSKNPTGPALVFNPSEWDMFLASARKGAFDRP
ncbi:DUF397 domain-containing protein [Nocardia cyriacigeorgica]|uniref:DUF397 domain-containing protein n=1 Tax=Nocardia cyriacigeorgica TaxID=135487 RepID=UPI001895BB42|nr:DUF397 domain-containing protein [Nocardia cyriacigeorgica]MBF6088743.1 DUF397 domain-containing protein [Nocardia cyriacigeorgica]MBF6100321.1 DUF397 domain-containing protein [Nocardia cyriacigeorgica]MBF6157486.1 DUF397 domain-containing protein [Nocardia cyriacigeorgica]MBF6196457.1 DUF397 domain-containing protein [Nocardia cyriacigeorgica]MBF6318291.1 DUF397 domain-containing protein [Nocardia cyriacigeorgica]